MNAKFIFKIHNLFMRNLEDIARQGSPFWDIISLHFAGKRIPDIELDHLKSQACVDLIVTNPSDFNGSIFQEAICSRNENRADVFSVCVKDFYVDSPEDLSTLELLYCTCISSLASVSQSLQGLLVLEDVFFLISPYNLDHSTPWLPEPILELIDDLPPSAKPISQIPTSSNQDLGVIVPTRNRSEKLKDLLTLSSECLFEPDSLIFYIIDDNSTDDTEQVVGKLQNQFDNLNIEYYKSNGNGPGHARNFGIAKAKSTSVLFIGDDFQPTKDLFAKHIRFHRENPNLNSGLLGITEWSSDANPNELMNLFLTEAGYSAQFANETLVNKHSNAFVPSQHFFYTSNLSIKRELLLTFGLFYTDIFHKAMLEDIELGIRLAKYGLKLYFDPSVIGHHNHHITIKDIFKRQITYGQYITKLVDLHPELRDAVIHPQYSDKLYINDELISTVLACLDEVSFGSRPNSKEMAFLLPLIQQVLDLGVVTGTYISQNHGVTPPVELSPTLLLIRNIKAIIESLMQKVGKEQTKVLHRASILEEQVANLEFQNQSLEMKYKSIVAEAAYLDQKAQNLRKRILQLKHVEQLLQSKSVDNKRLEEQLSEVNSRLEDYRMSHHNAANFMERLISICDQETTGKNEALINQLHDTKLFSDDTLEQIFAFVKTYSETMVLDLKHFKFENSSLLARIENLNESHREEIERSKHEVAQAYEQTLSFKITRPLRFLYSLFVKS